MLDHLSPDDIEKVRHSVQSLGFALLPCSVLPSLLTALQEEAEQRKNAALLAEQAEELRYRATITSLGPQARDFLCSPQMAQLLSAIFGGAFALTEQRSCTTIYHEGDHLGPHLDQPAEECEVTIIVYVAADGPALRSPVTGLQLRVYGPEMTENGEPRLTIPTHAGGIVIGHGSKFWHERPMLETGECVVALTGCYGYALAASNTLIPLDPSFLAAHGREETELELRRIVCSVKFELMERANSVRLLGPEMSYHQVDPHLPDALKKLQPGLTLADILTYKSKRKHFDLYFEDSWSGYFIAQRFQDHGKRDDLLFIHLDDHTDMMPTLLSVSGDTLADPTSGARFDPAASSDWEAAIHSGAVNIGNFLTPFYYSGCNVHVRHVKDSVECEEICHVVREPCQYALIPNQRFAAIAKSTSYRPESVGTYLAGPDPERVLDGAPRTWTLVHIDLDYFINDFNGASRGEDYTPDPILRLEAEKKMDHFFRALSKLNSPVDRWLIATSPGFCSGYHWEWLLSELESRIDDFQAASVYPSRSTPPSR